MVKIKAPLMSFFARGRLGAITFKKARHSSIAEKTPVVPDRQTILQLSQRSTFQACVDLWHLISASERAEWESLGSKNHMTGYACYLSQCLKPNPLIFLPLAGGTMRGNIDMAGFKIEDLPDPAAAQEPVTRQYFDDNLPVGGYTAGAKVYHGVDQVIPTATWTVVAFNGEDYDTDAIHDNITNNSRLTCKTAGKYLIIGRVVFFANAQGRREAQIVMSGVTNMGIVSFWPDAGGYAAQEVITILNLAVNDSVELYVRHTRPENLNLECGPDHGFTRFMMQRIG